MDGNRVESLYLIGHAGFGTVEADGGSGVSRCLGIRNLAGENYPALNGFGEHSWRDSGCWFQRNALRGKKESRNHLRAMKA